MKNTITSSPAKLIPQVTLVIPGIVRYGAILGMAPTMETTLKAKRAALIQADSDYEEGKIALATARKAQRLAIKVVRNHLRAVRELMRPKLTATYSQAWDALGFVGSLRLPDSVSGLVLALTKLGSHLAENPELGAEEPNLVAAKTIAIEAALSAAVTTVNGKKAALQRLLEDRAGVAEEVRYLLREVMSVLRLKLSPLDGRWAEFGFNKPGARPTPDKPTEVTATMISGTDAMLVKWPAVPRAEHYRLYKQVIGVDEEMVFVGSTRELDYLIEEAPANTKVAVALSAVNDSGESVRSAAIVVQTRVLERPNEAGIVSPGGLEALSNG